MSNCTRCGAYIPMGDTACPACGYDPEKEKTPQNSYSCASGAAAQAQQPETHTRQEEQSQTGQQAMTWAPWHQEEKEEARYDSSAQDGYAAPHGAEDEEKIRRLTVLSYVGPLFLLPLLLYKGNDFVRFHANQGLLLFLTWLAVDAILAGPLWVAGAGFCLYSLVMGAKAAASGRRVELPFIGKFRLIK